MSNQRIMQFLVASGLYRPARYLHDRWLRPERLKEQRMMREAFALFVKAGDLCFDVGANIGQKSEPLQQLGARVVAVEPQPHCMDELKARCGHKPGFTAIQKAIGRAPGRATLHISRDAVFSSMYPDWATPIGSKMVYAVEVEVATLDQLVEAYGVPDFCKIDVEGFESEVFAGLTRPLKTVSFEFHNWDHPEFRPVTLQCLEHLAGLGTIRLNVALGEDMTLLLDEFLPYAEFLAYFDELCQKPDTIYGDIYVRFEPAPQAHRTGPPP